MIDINVTILFQLVNFFIGLLIINSFIIRPIREILAKRRATVDGLSGDAKGLKRRAESKLTEYDARIAKVRHEISIKREELKIVAFAKAHQMQDKAAEEARLLRQDAQQKRISEAKVVYKELNSSIDKFASEVTHNLLSL